MKRIAHKTALHFSGWTFIILGILAGFLPIIPGFVLVALGVYLISLASLSLWNRIENLKVRFPKLAHHYDRLDLKISRYIKKAH